MILVKLLFCFKCFDFVFVTSIRSFIAVRIMPRKDFGLLAQSPPAISSSSKKISNCSGIPAKLIEQHSKSDPMKSTLRNPLKLALMPTAARIHQRRAFKQRNNNLSNGQTLCRDFPSRGVADYPGPRKVK